MAEGAGKVSDEIQRREELKRNKTKALRRLTLRQLQYMARNYGVEVTSQELVFFDEKAPKLTKDDYIVCIRSGLSYEEIINYLKKRKINVSDLMSESNQNNGTTVSKKTQNDIPQTGVSTELSSDEGILHSVLSTISQEFDNSLKVVDEYDFESHVVSILNFTYGKKGWNISRQVQCGESSDKIDIVLENNMEKIGIELKIGESKSYIRSSFGQLYDYSEHYGNIALVVLDIGKIKPDFYEDFEPKLKKFNIPLLVIEGNKRKRRGKTKTIKIS